jgi:hypothetical protein
VGQGAPEAQVKAWFAQLRTQQRTWHAAIDESSIKSRTKGRRDCILARPIGAGSVRAQTVIYRVYINILTVWIEI